MRLLFHSYCYPPLRYPRSIQVARLAAHLTEGTVTVVAGDEEGDGDRSLLEAYPDADKEIVRVPWSPLRRRLARTPSERIAEKVVLPDRFRLWQGAAAREISRRRSLDGIDALVTFGQPMSDHLLGPKLGKHPWIAHFSDPWTDNPFRDRGRLAGAVNARLEARIVREADTLLFTAQEALDLVMAKYSAELAAKAHVLPHAHDPSLYPAEDERRGGIVVRYLGTFYGHRSPEPLFRALERFAGELRDVRIELVGQGALPENAPRNVTARPPVDYLESLRLMRSSDLLLVLDAPAERSPFLPSKLVDYAGARRPIVALAPEGPSAALVRRLGGWVGDPADPDASAGALAEGLKAARERPAEWGNDEVVVSLSADVIARRFLELVQAVRSA
jgi:glycosyltransferase involved in cell wall biosynthesis